MATIELSNVLIPKGCTHWAKIKQIFALGPERYLFYKVFGPADDIVYIWWNESWMPFEAYQTWVLKNTMAKTAPSKPDFSRNGFNRCGETANDKLARVAQKLKDATV